MFQQKLISAFLILSFALPIAAQKSEPLPAKPRPQAEEIPAAVKNKAVAWLKLTAKDASQMNLPENRAVFALQIAPLLWKHDETEARALYEGAKADMRLILADFRRKLELEEEDLGSEERQNFYQFARSTKEMRTRMILQLAEYDGASASVFYRETREFLFAPTTNAPTERFKTQISEAEENQLETRLNAVLVKNDPTRALAFALEQLAEAKTVPAAMNELLSRLHAKDAEKGAKLAAAMVKKYKSAKEDLNYETGQAAFDFFRKAAATYEKQKSEGANKQPLLSESELRDFAEFLLKKTTEEDSYISYLARQNTELLTKYAPTAATAAAASNRVGTITMTADVGTAVATNANTRVVVNGNANTISPEELQRIARENAENEKRQKELADFGKKLETPDAKITLDEAKQKLALIKSREERFFAQTVVAATLAKRGDKDSARVLLDEARSQLPSRPTFYVDCIKFAMVARAYIDVDAEQTFQMLDTLVFQLNDLLGGLVKFGEFLGGDSIVANGEFRFGMFGDFFGDLVGGGGAGFDSAPSFGAGRGNPLGGFQDDLIKLSIADFQRLQTTADKFERSEVRLTARMLILSSVLQDKDAADTSYRIQPSERY